MAAFRENQLAAHEKEKEQELNRQAQASKFSFTSSFLRRK